VKHNWEWVCVKQLFRCGWTTRIVGIASLQNTRWLSGTVYLRPRFRVWLIPPAYSPATRSVAPARRLWNHLTSSSAEDYNV